MRIHILMVVGLLYIGLVPALAENVTSDSRITYTTQTAPCPMTENAQVNVNFNSQETDLAQIKTIMNDKLKEIEALAKEAGVEQFDLQSMNYSIYANNPGGCNCSSEGGVHLMYQLSGNMSFNTQPSGKATDLMILLNKKGYTSGLNVNMFRQCR